MISKIFKDIRSSIHLQTIIGYSLPPESSDTQIICGEYQLIKNGGQFMINLDELRYEYIIPKLKLRIQKNSLVKYIGNKINIRNIEDMKWIVIDIKQSKDNPNLDQCVITNNEIPVLVYIVFRKELKIIKSN